jgi:hypothetical protein
MSLPAALGCAVIGAIVGACMADTARDPSAWRERAGVGAGIGFAAYFVVILPLTSHS